MGTQAKDFESFNRVYETNKDLILKTAMKYSDNYHVAQELTQNIFLKFYTNFDTYDMDYAVKWLVVSVKNAAKNYKIKAAREIPYENIVLTSELRQSADSAEKIMQRELHNIEAAELKDDILSALYRVNERWYDAVTMVYVFERRQQDVADELGISIEVLHSLLYRARKWIKKNFKERYDATRYT